MNREQETYEDIIRYKKCVDLSSFYELTKEYKNNDVSLINEKAVYDGIYNVAFELRNKPLKISLDKIKNPHYKNILLKLGKHEKIIV